MSILVAFPRVSSFHLVFNFPKYHVLTVLLYAHKST